MELSWNVWGSTQPDAWDYEQLKPRSLGARQHTISDNNAKCRRNGRNQIVRGLVSSSWAGFIATRVGSEYEIRHHSTQAVHFPAGFAHFRRSGRNADCAMLSISLWSSLLATLANLSTRSDESDASAGTRSFRRVCAWYLRLPPRIWTE